MIYTEPHPHLTWILRISLARSTTSSAKFRCAYLFNARKLEHSLETHMHVFCWKNSIFLKVPLSRLTHTKKSSNAKSTLQRGSLATEHIFKCVSSSKLEKAVLLSSFSVPHEPGIVCIARARSLCAIRRDHLAVVWARFLYWNTVCSMYCMKCQMENWEQSVRKGKENQQFDFEKRVWNALLIVVDDELLIITSCGQCFEMSWSSKNGSGGLFSSRQRPHSINLGSTRGARLAFWSFLLLMWGLRMSLNDTETRLFTYRTANSPLTQSSRDVLPLFWV